MPKLTLCEANAKFPVGTTVRSGAGRMCTVVAAGPHLKRSSWLYDGAEHVGGAFKYHGHVYLAIEPGKDTAAELVQAVDQRLAAIDADWPVGTRVSLHSGRVTGTVIDASTYPGTRDTVGGAFIGINGRPFVLVERDPGLGGRGGEDPTTLNRLPRAAPPATPVGGTPAAVVEAAAPQSDDYIRGFRDGLAKARKAINGL